MTPIEFGRTKKTGRKTFMTKAEPKKDSLDEVAPEDRAKVEAYRERAKAERARFQKATDSEFWLAVCFSSAQGLKDWRKEFGFGALGGMLVGSEVRDALAPFKPETLRRGFGSFGFGGRGIKAPDPLADVQYINNIESDALSELAALHSALVAVKPAKTTDPVDSGFYFTVVFEDRDDKEAFLSDFGLSQVGDKYLNGDIVAKKLKESK